nr:protein chromatin remodeling 20 isoform X1 [Tanacetum cinerariifolium]
MAADKVEEEEDIGSTSSDSFIDDSDNDEPSTSGQDDQTPHEQPLTDEDIEGLIAELVTVESKAAEAQEALEDESLGKVEIEVREELAQSLEGEALENAVAEEMIALREKWEDELDELETESSHLLEQLDGAGIELPNLYKWIESQAPNGCRTEAWKNRTHWAGSQVTGDANESIADAEKYLQTHRPVRRHRGKLLEEGASGFLGKRLAPEEDKEANRDVDWSSFNELCSTSTTNTSFGSKKWASVYMASTPQQAAELGLTFPGADEVEEIDDIEGSLNDPIVADAIKSERELYQSQDHKKNFKKVKEEDDVNIDRKLLHRLNQKRQRRKLKRKVIEEAEENDIVNQTSNTDHKTSSDVDMSYQKSNGLCGSKRLSDSADESDSKKRRTVNTDSSDVELLEVDGSTSPCSESENLDHSDTQENADTDEFRCTACDKVANDVYTHPLFKDPDCAECFCGWCGRIGDLVSCGSCKNLFCTSCIKKNLGEDCLLKAQGSGWKCCCCSPSILQPLTSLLEKAFTSRSESSSSSDDSDDSNDGLKVPIRRLRITSSAFFVLLIWGFIQELTRFRSVGVVVKEEDDVNIDRKLLHRLNQKRQRRKLKRKVIEEAEENDIVNQTSNTDHKTSSDVDMSYQKSNGLCGSKRLSDSADESDSKKRRTVNTDSSDVELLEVDGSTSPCSESENLDHSDTQENADTDEFRCTACDKVANDVYTHPLFKDPDCAECFCGWCGRIGDLVSCGSCKNLFCTSCIKKNLGEDCLLKAQGSGWKCCCCSPSILQPLTSLLEKAFTSRSESSSSSDDSDDSNDGLKVPISKRRRKKKIREDTKRKIAIEKERQERLKSLEAERMKSLKSMKTNYANFKATVSQGATADMLGDAQTGYIVNVVREENEEAVRLPQSISTKLKTHQVAGIRFMWENIIQSITKVRSGDKGLGCILAHTMGLGKTLQVIAFLYAAMRCVDIGLKTAMIVTPVNVLHNWKHEFEKWKPTEYKHLRVFMLDDVPRDRRLDLLMKWRAKGGVFLIGYTNFRNLSLGKHIKDRNMAKELCKALEDGPDILVCDEAHMIKNTRADTTQALKLVKSQRRIALTGSPLQNNLMEYYCMVDFVREGFLGSSQEFRNRFQNPIENGQHTNSTSDDEILVNFPKQQRMDMNVVKKDLPPKTVFVIAVKLSPMQRVLYKRFLDVHGLAEEKTSNEKTRKSFFAGYQALAQIWNHPGILQLMKDKDFSKRENVVELEYSSSDDNLDYTMGNGDKLGNRNGLSSRKNVSGFFKENWWDDLVSENGYDAENSGKMVLLLDILTMCSDIGDKALVFSQSIPTLDLIERHLSKLTQNGKSRKHWKKGKDWYRLDGRTEGSERQQMVEKFNDPKNERVKCTLISTRAGSLGINLYAANRVIIVDGSWNPTYDLQAIYRAWRYGQTKPVFAYRLMAHGTMEEKIYKRQVTKESLSARVVDRQQVHRTISKEEMLHLFAFADDENLNTSSKLDQVSSNVSSAQSTNEVGNCSKQKSSLAHATISSDKFMEKLLSKHQPRWIANYHEHESLLQENEDEKLSKEEQDMAWEVYRRTLEWEEVQRVSPGDMPPPPPPPIPKPTANGTSEAKSTVQPQPSTKKNPPVVNRVDPRAHWVLRKCTNIAHMLTLKSQGVKPGCTTICGECGKTIGWNGLNK